MYGVYIYMYMNIYVCEKKIFKRYMYVIYI